MSEYYVSALGNDVWSGLSEDSAFATPDAAIKAMAANATADTTYLLGGHYYLNGSGLSLTNANSNDTITAYPGTNPVISGGTEVPTSDWSVGADGIWSCQLSSNNVGQLTVGGQRQTLARYPKAAPDDPIRSGWLWAQALPNGSNPLRQMAYNPTDFPAEHGPTVDQRATVFDANNWSNSVLTITAVDTTNHVITFDKAVTYYIGPGSRYFLSGSKPLLNEPGEWHFDQATGTLYFNPPSGFNGAGAVVSGTLSLVNITHAENITIKGLTFSDAATNAQNDAWIDTAAVNINSSIGISITGNHFINVAQGVRIGGDSNGNLVSNNDFSNVWAQSISVSRGTSHNHIAHNSIQNSGEVFAAASAVQLDNTWNNIVSNNTIRNVPRSGIGDVRSDAFVRSGANVIEHNTIVHSGQVTDDSGAIYVASPGAPLSARDVIRHNTVIDAGGLGTTSSGFIDRQHDSAGIYVDTQLIAGEISGNIIQGATLGGVYLRGSSNNEVHDNIITEGRLPAISSAEIDASLVPINGAAMSDNAIYDNTISLSSSESSLYSAADTPLGLIGDEIAAPGSAANTDITTKSAAQLRTNYSAPPLSISDGATAEIYGPSAQSATFEGSSGGLILDDALAFTGHVSGLSGSDAIDLADVSYGPSTRVTFLGDTEGGTLTITNGTQTANIALVGDYLSSYWTASSDGSGGTLVVDPTSSNTWQPVNIGSGGYLTGLDVAPDGVMVVRTDTYGAYIWNGTQWVQLVTATSMPSAFVAPNLDNQGVYEIQIAPSNSNIMYMMFDGNVFKTTNEGTTWTETSFAPVTESTNDVYRMYGQKMAIDPDNPNIVFVGTPLNGLFVTSNGGTTWQSVSGIPKPVASGGNSPGFTGIEFDPANTNIIFAASYGNGVYETTNGGTTWSLLTNGGGPGSVQYATISSTGVYYVVGDNDSDLWSYANGTWTELLTGQIDAVAVNPSNPNELVVEGGADLLNESLNSGISWGGWTTNATSSSPAIPWLQGSIYLGVSALAFNPLDPNELLVGGQTSFWTATVPQTITSNTPIVWTSQGIGVEQLVANEIIVPPGGNPVAASWDWGFNYISNPQVPTSAFSSSGTGAVSAGWSIAYAVSDPSFLVGISDGAYAGGGTTEQSGYSTNGGQTWTAFPTDPPGVGTGDAYGGPWGGSIAASTPSNIVWAPANGNQAYYTTNGGNTWNPVSLPGVTSWANIGGEFYENIQNVTADTVLPNTFYMVANTYGVYETTNGGVTWTQVYAVTGSLFYYVGEDAMIAAVPGEAGNLFYSPGLFATPTNGFFESTDGGAAWSAVANVNAVDAFGFGAAAPGESYPAIYIAGWVNNVYGIWQSINDAQSWTQIGTYPDSSLDIVRTISGNPNVYGEVYIGFGGSGYAYLSANGPAVTAIVTSPPSGLEEAGAVVTLTLGMSEVVTVAGGTPTLTLNDGGTATYTGGSGTDALTFSYTVAAGQSTSALAATTANLNGATITDSGGNAANLSLSSLSQQGPQIDALPPAITAVIESPASGILQAGAAVTLTLDMSEVVTVNTTGGAPTLTLSNGGTATYAGGSGSSALTFTYTVVAQQNISNLAATAVNLNGATISNANDGSANLSLSGVMGIDGNGSSNTSHVTLTTVNPNDVIILNIEENGSTVASVTDTAGLTWHLEAVAGVGAGGTNQIYQYYAIAPHALSADAITVNFTGTASFVGLNAFGISGANTSSPFDTNSAIPGTANSGTATVNTSNANDLILAAYRFGDNSSPSAGSGWTAIDGSNYLLTEYQVVSTTQTGLAATASTTDEDGGIVDAVVAATGTTGPTVSSVVESPSNGDLNVGNTLTLTLGMNEVVTVNTTGGAPTLTLNDGGTATYVSGSGSGALVFTYTVAVGQNTAALAATAVNLNGATITAGAGNAANLSLSGLTQTGPQIGTPPPVISSIAESPSSGDLNAGKTVTLTLDMSEVVTVNTTGGSPTLTLNDGGTATYLSGTGTSTLTFSYTVAAGQDTPDLMVTAVNLNGATITNGPGTAANFSLTGITQGSPQIDTTTPAAPVITDDTINGNDTIILNGTAQANSTISVLVGSTELGTTTANANGAWSYTTGELAAGSYTFAATATDAAGNASAASKGIDPTIGLPETPAIVSFSPDTGTIGDDITNAAILTLTGTAAINSTIEVFDELTELGATTANASGAWSYTTGTLKNGAHSFTAIDTIGINASAPSPALDVTVDTVPPAAPVIAQESINAKDSATLSGTAAANSTLEVFDGTTELGTTTANSSGAWSYTTGTLASGVHSLTATDTDVAGNVSVASAAVTMTVGSVAPTAPIIVNDTVNTNDTVILVGTAESNSTLNVLDGSTDLGTTTANSNGAWSYKTGTLAAGTHSFTATDTVADDESGASAALTMTVAATEPTSSDSVGRTHSAHASARGLHSPVGKLIDGATLDGIFGVSSPTTSHHFADLSTSPTTASDAIGPSDGSLSVTHEISPDAGFASNATDAPKPDWSDAGAHMHSNTSTAPSGFANVSFEQDANVSSGQNSNSGASWTNNTTPSETISADATHPLGADGHFFLAASNGPDPNFAGTVLEVTDAFLFKPNLGDGPIKSSNTALDQINLHDLFEHFAELRADLHAAAVDGIPDPSDTSTSHIVMQNLHPHDFHFG